MRFSDKQPWDSPLYVRISSKYRSIVPAKRDFMMGDAYFVVLDETKIVEVPIQVFG